MDRRGSYGRVWARGRSLVGVANEQVSILFVASAVGCSVPSEVPGKSVKVFCPFGVHHADLGQETAFRIYTESNSAYCFAGCGFYTPVRLYAQAFDLQPQDAAVSLLDLVGYRPLDLAHLWEKVASREPEPDTSALAEALKVWCGSQHPGWGERQFEEPVAGVLGSCLALLPKVQTEEDARQWLAVSKRVMSRVLAQG